MNNDFPIFSLGQPEIVKRRSEKSRRLPTLPPEVLARRQEIAYILKNQIEPLANLLREMPDEERKSVFVKIKHQRPVKLIGLKPVAEPTENLTLAIIPEIDKLDNLLKKVEDFGTGELNKGQAPNEYLAAINQIQQGEPKDRLCQVFFEQYDELIQQEWIICEIEMMSLQKGKNQQRDELQEIRSELERLLRQSPNYGNIFEHEEIKGTCRAVIRCDGRIFQQLVEDEKWQTKIFWFDARPEFETFIQTYHNFNIQSLGQFISPPDNAPIVCIVDSGVTPGNPFLQPIVRENLLHSFLNSAPDNPYDEHGHGSGVASLASYYALNGYPGSDNEGKVWIASARVLDRDNLLEDERLFSKILIEVVETFVPLGVRIFNLSVGIINRKWNAEAKRTVPRRSWIARTIDRLSREKDIVFVISAGNIFTNEIRYYWQDGITYPKYFVDEEASILDPAQSALSLTVGSLAATTLAAGNVATAMAIAEQRQPSPFTRCGPGIGKEIKPELVELGGNYLIDENNFIRTNLGTNIVMASNQITPAIAHNSGTSFATPRVVHKLAQIFSDLQALGLDYISAPLLKAFIVNSASYSEDPNFEHFRSEMDSIQSKHWLNIVGYGMPDHYRATYCDPYSAILFFQGEIIPNNVAYFDIPVPACLAEADKGTKRLTVTVVHAPEVQRWGLERYLGTTLKWRMFRGDVEREDIRNAMSLEDDQDNNEGDLAKPKELSFNIGLTLRSRGTVQHDIFEWKIHRQEHSNNFYTLAIAAYEKWGRENPSPVSYAVVVRLEDTTQSALVYAEVQNILASIEAQTQGRS
ncbi:S8 family peptidase [Anabaena cylindrica UHCC 0172]|uniref:S8 family peptidase n=1 Tax=Anabaena cylindrica TaxID=1165 RepID=UPI002B1FED35|nr:S8 family peptidase [Anabaena cylindrica]MEA5550197.1 S8 family peptidase [Anabaena cylindrica UHCC 0172]